MKLEEFRAFLEKNSLQNLWWLALDDSVLDEQFTLEEIAAMRAETPSSTFSLLNIAHSEDPNAQWQDLNDLPAVSKSGAAATEGVEEQIAALRQQVQGIEEFLRQIHGHFIAKENLELKEIELKEREKFLEESEEALLQKIQVQEEQLAELEQHREDMGEDESELKAS
ncbi:MAG: hypothetical protein ACFB21_09070 [Opitutales bacterium]